MFPARF